MSFPLVTINILSFNRKDELKFTLSKVFEQDYHNIEVIVVDNASSDGTREMVKSEFPDVILIELEKNIGIAGWNKGFEIAKGEYVLVLDDDSYPEKGTIDAGTKTLLSDESVAVVGFTIYNSYFGLIENNQEYIASKGKTIETIGFIGCGALIKKSIFLEFGGFEKSIFLYFNELEFSIRVRNFGYRILFEPQKKVIHSYSLTQRDEKVNKNVFINERRFEHTFRSYFIFQYLHFDLQYFLKYSVKLILSKFYIALKLGFINTYFLTLFSIFTLIFALKDRRNPVSIDIQKEFNYANLKFKDLYVYYPD